MEPSFWIDRWREGKIGFHEGQPNALLVRFAARLGAGTRVLVPLCGKTVDLAYLAAHGHTVVGIELVEDAVRAFFSEHQLVPRVTRTGPLAAYSAGAITLIAGDVFHVGAAHVGEIGAIYDRAATIALPAELRPRYIAQLRTLAPAGTPGLLVTVDYPQDRMDGPPFSVPDAEVQGYYPAAEMLADHPTVGSRLSEIGPGRPLGGDRVAHERCYAITL